MYSFSVNGAESKVSSNALLLRKTGRVNSEVDLLVRIGIFNHLECELHRLSLALHPSAPPEPLDEVLQQYTETLCTAQKQTTFVNTLLQDITIFSGRNSSHLEDWLVDLETPANLTREIRTKLAQAKSKGFNPHINNSS